MESTIPRRLLPRYDKVVTPRFLLFPDGDSVVLVPMKDALWFNASLEENLLREAVHREAMNAWRVWHQWQDDVRDLFVRLFPTGVIDQVGANE